MSALDPSSRDGLAQNLSVPSESSSSSSQLTEVLQRLGNIEGALALLRFPMPEQALTLSQVAKVLQVSVRTVRTIIERGELQAISIALSSGRKLYRINQSALREFMQTTSAAPSKVRRPRKRELIQVPEVEL